MRIHVVVIAVVNLDFFSAARTSCHVLVTELTLSVSVPRHSSVKSVQWLTRAKLCTSISKKKTNKEVKITHTEKHSYKHGSTNIVD